MHSKYNKNHLWIKYLCNNISSKLLRSCNYMLWSSLLHLRGYWRQSDKGAIEDDMFVPQTSLYTLKVFSICNYVRNPQGWYLSSWNIYRLQNINFNRWIETPTKSSTTCVGWNIDGICRKERRQRLSVRHVDTICRSENSTSIQHLSVMLSFLAQWIAFFFKIKLWHFSYLWFKHRGKIMDTPANPIFPIKRGV